MLSKTSFERKLNTFLRQSADFAYILSKYTCKRGYVDKKDCSWYHGVWQYLRLCDKASAPTWHFEFYVSALSNILKEGQSVLISSAADYTTLAVLIEVVKRLEVNISIEVADICKTPLILNDWYAEQMGFEVKSINVDIRNLDVKDMYDIIITDAFLTRFNSDEKKVVTKRWFDSLKSGGYIITTTRLEQNLSNEWILPPKKEISNFVSCVEDCLKKIFCSNTNKSCCRKVSKIINLAEIYSQRMRSYPFKSNDEVITFFQKYGFEIKKQEVATVKGEFKPTTYCRVVAQKPKMEE